MALLSKKEFADLCFIETKNLSNYITRGKVIVENELIDTKNQFNRFFLEKRSRKSDGKPPTEPIIYEAKVLKDKEPPKEEQTGERQSYTESERQLKYLDTLKRQKEIEKLEFEVQKKRGEVVPNELIKPVFLQHNQSILTEYKNASDEIVRIFSKKRSLTVNEVAEIKTELVKTINDSMNKAIVISIKAIDSIISDYSDKRGIGEHG